MAAAALVVGTEEGGTEAVRVAQEPTAATAAATIIIP